MSMPTSPPRTSGAVHLAFRDADRDVVAVLSFRIADVSCRPFLAESAASVELHKAAIEGGYPCTGACRSHRSIQISVCSEISRASSTSIPRYLTVDSSLEWPSSNCTARRFLVRR